MRLRGLPYAVTRGILRAAAELDGHPGYKALIRPDPAPEYDPTLFGWGPAAPSCLTELLRGRLYRPQAAGPAASVRGYLKRLLRQQPLPEPVALDLMRRLDSAVGLGRRLTLPLPASQSAQPGLRYCPEEPLRPGRLLVAHPIRAQSALRRGVVLLAQHEAGTGGHGVMLNLPSVQAVGQVATGEQLAGPLGERPLLVGGDSGHNSMTLLHRFPGLKNAVQIRGDLYYGGDITAVNELLTSGAAEPTDFVPVAGFCSWLPHQLEGLVDQNVWLPVEPAAGEVSDLVLGPTFAVDRAERVDFDWCRDQAGEVWRGVMQQVGGEFDQLAAIQCNRHELARLSSL